MKRRGISEIYSNMMMFVVTFLVSFVFVSVLVPSYIPSERYVPDVVVAEYCSKEGVAEIQLFVKNPTGFTLTIRPYYRYYSSSTGYLGTVLGTDVRVEPGSSTSIQNSIPLAPGTDYIVVVVEYTGGVYRGELYYIVVPDC